MTRMAVVLGLLLAFAAAPASAATKWKRLGVFAGGPVAAGDGRIVVPFGEHGFAHLGPNGVVRTYQFGPTCDFNGLAGGGRAFATCGSYEEPYWEVMALTTGTISTARPSPEQELALRGELGIGPSGIGRQWTEWRVLGNHYAFSMYWNLASDTIASMRGPDARQTVDLDAPQLVVPLCSPVRRPANRENQDLFSSAAFVDVLRTERWVVFHDWPASSALAWDATELFAWRCGHRRPIRVSTCRDDETGACSRPAVRNGLVAWASVRGVRMMDLRNQRRFLLDHPAGTSRAHVAIGSGRRIYAAYKTEGPAAETEVFVSPPRR